MSEEATPLQRALRLLNDYIRAAGGDADDEALLSEAAIELRSLYYAADA